MSLDLFIISLDELVYCRLFFLEFFYLSFFFGDLSVVFLFDVM